MIKINLLPVREWRRKEAVRQQISIYILSIALLVSGLFATGITIQGKVSSQKNTIKELQAKKKKLSYVNAKIQQVQTKRKEVETKFQAIEDLQKGRTLAVRLIDEVVSSLPMDRTWLTSLKFNQSQLQLSGIALDNHTVALFMKRLESSSLCNDVSLKDTRRKTIDGHDLMEFSLNIKVKFGQSTPDGDKDEKGRSK